MHFEEFGGRRTLIRKAVKSDFKDYELHTGIHSMREYDKIDYDKISELPNCQYLAIERENGKMIGIIKIDMSEREMFVEISIPNDAWNMRYGTDALHQFIKCCQERKLCDVLRLKKENTIILRYKRERPEGLKEEEDTFVLKIA